MNFVHNPGMKIARRMITGIGYLHNSLHWVLEVAFREDDCRVRTGHADQNLASLRPITLNLLRQSKRSKVGIKNRRLKAGWDLRFLERIITG